MRGEVSVDHYRRPPGSQLPFTLREEGGGGPRTQLVCGFLGCDARPFNPLLATLPRTLRVSAREGGGWLESLARLAVAESTSGRTGGECVLARASELMFVEVIRRYLASLPPEQTGWLAGLRDPSSVARWRRSTIVPRSRGRWSRWRRRRRCRARRWPSDSLTSWARRRCST